MEERKWKKLGREEEEAANNQWDTVFNIKEGEIISTKGVKQNPMLQRLPHKETILAKTLLALYLNYIFNSQDSI